jgi:hypothetical protein
MTWPYKTQLIYLKKKQKTKKKNYTRYALTETHVIPPGATTKCWVPLVFPLVIYTHREREERDRGTDSLRVRAFLPLFSFHPSVRPFMCFFFQNGRMMMKGEREKENKMIYKEKRRLLIGRALTCGSLSTWVQVRDGVGGETKKKEKTGDS